MKKILLLLAVASVISCTKKEDSESIPSVIKDLTIENLELKEKIEKYKQLYGELQNIDINKEFGIWSVGYYVDEFKESTNEPYAHTTIYGRFSNSATTDSDLKVKFLIDKEDIRIQLYEYAMEHPIKGKGFIKFKAKNNLGKIIEFKTYNNASGDNSLDSGISYDKFIKYINESNTIKFKGIIYNSYGNTEYDFTLPNGAGLIEALNNGQ